MKYVLTRTGQAVLTCKVPHDIINTINNIIDQQINNLPRANDVLVGKIKDEFVLFSEFTKFNCLPNFVLDWFVEAFNLYLNLTEIQVEHSRISSIWFNEMKKNEYNPVHIHRGGQVTGLSSVMFLKLPNTYGEEYSNEKELKNGRLELISPQGQFNTGNLMPKQEVGHFLIFPYDMPHIVYPFNSTNEIRRTLSCNFDVVYSDRK